MDQPSRLQAILHQGGTDVIVRLENQDLCAQMDTDYGGTLFDLRWRGGMNLVNRYINPGTRKYDWGREWQVCLFEGLPARGYGVEDLWVNPTQAAGDYGRIRNPILELEEQTPTSARFLLRMKEYSPLRPGWSDYKREYYRRYRYPDTGWIASVEYRLHTVRGPAGDDMPAIRMEWNLRHEEPGPIELVSAICHLWTPAEIRNEHARDLSSWKDRLIRDRWIELDLRDTSVYVRAQGGDLANPSRDKDWISVACEGRNLSGWMDLVFDPKASSAVFFVGGRKWFCDDPN